MKALLTLCAALLINFFSQQACALVVLQYHHIADDTPAATSTSPTRFAEHLAYLHKEGFRVIDLATALKAINEEQLPLPKTALITFDDGLKSVHDTALPLLKKYDYPFVVFVNTQAVEQQIAHTLTWQEINTLKKHGGAIANHSTYHSHMVRKQADESEHAWRSRIRQDIEQAQSLIHKHTGDNYLAFAYPFGEYSTALKDILKDLGYIAFGQHSGPVGNFDKQALPRFPMGGASGDKGDFQLKVNTQPFEVFSVEMLTNKGNTKPFDPVLELTQTQPTLAIEVQSEQQLKTLNCYLSPGDKTQKALINQTTAHFTATDEHPIGRSRLNCTAPTGDKHYYWHSLPFIRRHADGRWAKE